MGNFNKMFRPLPVEMIIEKAESSLNQLGYNLIYDNCEHFATGCRYGEEVSQQVGLKV